MKEYKTTWCDMSKFSRDEANYMLEHNGKAAEYPDPEVPDGDGWELVGGPTFENNFMIWTWVREVGDALDA